MYCYESFTDNELLKLIVAERCSENSIDELIEKYPLNELLTNTTETELLNVKGLTPKKAQKILAVNELIKRLYKRDYLKEAYFINKPKDAADLLMQEMRFLNKEHLKVILLNTKNKVLNVELVSIGSLSSSIVHPREIFLPAVKRSAASIILCHNHPSSDVTPSSEDINVTLRIKEAGKMMGIELLDHIIIGNGTFTSLKERGVL